MWWHLPVLQGGKGKKGLVLPAMIEQNKYPKNMVTGYNGQVHKELRGHIPTALAAESVHFTQKKPKTGATMRHKGL